MGPPVDTAIEKKRQPVLHADVEVVGIVHYEMEHITMGLHNSLGLAG